MAKSEAFSESSLRAEIVPSAAAGAVAKYRDREIDQETLELVAREAAARAFDLLGSSMKLFVALEAHRRRCRAQ